MKSAIGSTRTPLRPTMRTLGVERDQAARPVGGGIGQRHAAADGAVVADRTVGDLAGDAAQQAAENIRHLAVFDGGMGGQRAEPQAVGRLARPP